MKEFQPRTQRQNEAPVEINQPEGGRFARGVYNDLAGPSVPLGALHDSIGYVPFEDRMEPCGGCSPWSDTILPAISGRTGYTWSKTGSRITKSAGPDNFSADDVGNWLVHDDGTHELITAYVGVNSVDVESSEVHAASTAGWLRGQINNKQPDKPNALNLLHIGDQLYVFDSAVTAYTKCYSISYRGLLNSFSVVDYEGDYAIIFNAGGIFRVDLNNGAPYFYWKINTPVPRTLLTGTVKDLTTPYGHKYTYGLARISGESATRDRTTVSLEHETGTCKTDASTYLDYAEKWTERNVGDESTTYSVLTGCVLGYIPSPSSQSLDPAYWSSIINGQWGMAINGVTYYFSCDFTGVFTIMDVANRMQTAIRTVNEKLTCEFVEDHFVFTNPEEGGTLGYSIAGTAGTDIGSGIMGCDSGHATITSPTYTQNIVVETLHCPTDPIEAAEYQRHHTHYPVFRSLDIGKNGIDPLTAEGNNEEQFIWLMDVPIAKSFVASRSGAVVTASEGSFQAMDRGSKFRFQDGTEITLGTYISTTQMNSTDSGTINSQAAAIGGDNSLSKPIRVMSASQNGQTVTRTAGSTFSLADVGKTMFWPTGLRTHLIAYIDQDNMTGAEDQNISATAACMDPKCRNFCDTISDDTLRGRISDRFSLFHRFWEELPDCDTGKLTTGWIYAAVRETKIAYYNQITQMREHLVGYYYPARQYLTYKDTILGFSDFTDIMAVYCSGTTTVHPTNTFLRHSINKIQEAYIVAGQTVADSERGACDCGSWKRLPDKKDLVITNEPRVRIFDGMSFSVDIADKRYTKTIEKFQKAMGIQYDGINGITIFGKDG